MYKTRMMKVLLAVVAVFSIHASMVYGASITGISVDQQGNVGIGTDTPQSLLNLEFDALTLPEMKAAGIKFMNINSTYPGSAKTYLSYSIFDLNALTFEIDDVVIMTLFANGLGWLGSGWIQVSDISMKENISQIDGACDKISRLRGVTYNWKDRVKKGDRLHMGLIAQEVEKEFPEVVFTNSEGVKGIAYSGLVAPLIEAVKELKAENESMAGELANLRKRVVALEKR